MNSSTENNSTKAGEKLAKAANDSAIAMRDLTENINRTFKPNITPRTAVLISKALKTCGAHPNAFSYIEEDLYCDEVHSVQMFMEWLGNNTIRASRAMPFIEENMMNLYANNFLKESNITPLTKGKALLVEKQYNKSENSISDKLSDSELLEIGAQFNIANVNTMRGIAKMLMNKIIEDLTQVYLEYNKLDEKGVLVVRVEQVNQLSNEVFKKLTKLLKQFGYKIPVIGIVGGIKLEYMKELDLLRCGLIKRDDALYLMNEASIERNTGTVELWNKWVSDIKAEHQKQEEKKN